MTRTANFLESFLVETDELVQNIFLVKLLTKFIYIIRYIFQSVCN